MEKMKTVKPKTYDCMFYSKVLKEPFNSIEELMEAEEAHYAKLKAKEDKAAEKKADATKVEEAFKKLNAARKAYKDNLNEATKIYSKGLADLKEGYEKTCKSIKDTLASAEADYANSLKAFTEKYPEGYHLTLKDGDFETTISSQTSGSTKAKATISDDFLDSFLDLIFGR
jgi:cytochrome c1